MYRLSVLCLTGLFRLLLLVKPRYQQIGLKNLQLAFPEKDCEWHHKILKEHCGRLARVVADFFRLGFLNATWVEEHVSFPFANRYKEIKRQDPDRGVLLVGGHLGSFEVLPLCVAVRVSPIAFIAREMRPAWFNRWVTKVRSKHGNRVIQRRGAFKKVLRSLNDGTDVGILFDQNVVRKDAVFVEWFGRPAATTKALGVAALRKKARVIVGAIRDEEYNRYSVHAEECKLDSIYSDSELSDDEKILKLTQQIVHVYEELIREDPAGWFWLHRRWKTSPDESIAEDFYD